MNPAMKKLFAMLTVLALLAAFAGCSSDAGQSADATDREESGADTAPAPGADGEDTLKIVVTTMMNSEYGDRAQIILDNLVRETNEAGGVLGRTVELEYLDIGSDQQSYINCIQKAINTDGVDAIIGSFYGEYAIAASDYILNAQIPTINLSINNIQLDMNEYYFISRASTRGVNGSWAQLAIDSGMTNPVIVCLNTDAGVSSTEAIEEAFAAEGLSVAKVIYYDSTNTTDYTPLMLEAMNVAGADGMILNMTANDDGQSSLDILYQYDYAYPVCACTSMMSTALSSVIGGESVNGVFGLAEYSPELDSEGNRIFVAKLDEWGYTGIIDWTGAVYYDVFKIICEAATLSGDTTAESIYQGITMIDNLEGAMTTYSYHDSQSFANYVYSAEFNEAGDIILGDPVAVAH